MFEIALAEADHRRPIELRAAPDVVEDARPEPRSARVEPGLLGDIFLVEEDRGHPPIILLAWNPSPAFNEQNLDAILGEPAGCGAAADAAPDHYHVVGIFHLGSRVSP